MYWFFKELKNSHLSGILSLENLLKLSLYWYGYTPFSFTNFNCSSLNSYDKHSKSLPNNFLTNESRLEFIHCMLSRKTKLKVIVKAIYFYNPFVITFTFTSNVPISYITNDCHNLSNYAILQDLFSQCKVINATPISRISIFFCNVTMISYFIIFHIK